ncbi:facilitated trehalose transporter Tret1-like [Hyposmocoma kahamanoa]|uniref:facilitated trehalose transporter Tret1-like n=1 Tax=Hyposmocoma kahamanoa TaxID=1477025 RepID=UPI000E6D73FF|nr:facilitated trehalose transporter Tret1-like [Hyposmocoma kahamanoa]
MLHLSWTQKVTNDEVLRLVGQKRKLLQTIKHENLAYLGHVLRHDRYELLQLIMMGKVPVSLGNFLTGLCFAWPSFALYVLQSDKSPTGSPISDFEANLVGSLVMLGNLFVTPFSAWISDMMGKKRSCILSALGFALSWAIIATTRSIHLILIGRIILGLSSGIQAVICFPFVAEISQDAIRGTLGSILILTYIFGMLIAYLIGWFCSYQVVNYVNLTISVLFVVLSCCLKETPAFLIAKGKDKDALKSLQFYRGASKATPKVLEEMALLNQENKSEDKTLVTEKCSDTGTEKELLNQTEVKRSGSEMSPWKTLCSSKSAQRALFVVTFHTILLVFGGTIAVTTYASQLFEKAAPNIANEICAVILAVAFLVGSVFSLVICDLVGRRVLMLTSTILSAVFLVLLASLLRWSWAPEWTIPAAVLGYCCVFQMGAAAVPFLQISECFVHKLKNLASTIANTAMCLGNFIVLALFPFSVNLLGLDGIFLLFAFICILLTLSTYFLMRETRSRSVDEIQKMFENGLLYRTE